MVAIQGPNASMVFKQNAKNKNRNKSASVEARAMDRVVTLLNIHNDDYVVDYGPDL